MATCTYMQICTRGLRRFGDRRQLRAPYLLKTKGGLRTGGPVRFDEWAWPSGDPMEVTMQNNPNRFSVSHGAHEFSPSPKIKHSKPWNGMLKNNYPEFRGYTGVQATGINDPNTGEYVEVKEMLPELIVPDLTGFKLKPYVSFRADEVEEKQATKFNEFIDKNGGELSDEEHWSKFIADPNSVWPPPQLTARQLFNWHYAPDVERRFKNGEYDVIDENRSEAIEDDSKQK